MYIEKHSHKIKNKAGTFSSQNRKHLSETYKNALMLTVVKRKTVLKILISNSGN